MSNDYSVLKDVFELAEVLTFENFDGNQLEIDVFDKQRNEMITVTFNFNSDNELIEACTGE